ncbi:hypothetical protein D3C84_1258470 [compost metagenome]
MMRVVTWSGQPKITVSTSAGAESATPTANPRWIRKMPLTSARTRASKRFSRNSYAVYTPLAWYRGAMNAAMKIMANGSPR